MAYEKEIKESLRNTYHAKMGLNDSSYEKVANILGATVEKEDQIETAVSGAEAWLKVIQGEADIVRNIKPKPTPPTPPTPPKEGDIAALVQNAIAAAVKPLTDEITALKTEKLQTSAKDKLVAIFKEKGVDPTFYEPVISGRSLTTEEEIQALEKSVVENYQKFAQHRSNEALGGVPKPILGEQNKDGVSVATQAYIEAKTAENKTNTLGGKAL